VIHPTAIVHPGARLGEGVQIGPYCVVGEHVEVGAGTRVGAHVILTGHTRIGRDNRIFPGACIGEEPQDKKYGGEPTRVQIGDRNTIREFCTINAGTVQEHEVTRVGDDNWIMAYAHIAHDNIIGNRTVIANSVQLAGHVAIEDWVILGGGTLVHQFCRVGAHAFTAGGSVVLRDVPPYVMAGGNSAQPHGINSEGLKRRGFSPESIERIRRAYKTLYRSGLSFEEAKQALAEAAANAPELQVLTAFLASSSRGIIR
jgi:UDP-N-acetylglucosamine acyltransferase